MDRLVATVFPDRPVKKGQLPAEPDFSLSPTAAPPVPPLYKLLNKNMIFRIMANGETVIARASLDGQGNMPFQYIGDENGAQEIVQGYYTVEDTDCGIAGTLTFHFHRPTGNLILSDYAFFGMSDGSRLWFDHVELGTNVSGECWNA